MDFLITLLLLCAAALIGILKAAKNYRVNTVLKSEVGRRYLANLEATGSATQYGNTKVLARLIAEREGILCDAKSNNIDLELVDALIRDKIRQTGPAPSGAIRAFPRSTTSSVSTIANELFRCGNVGARSLATVIAKIVQRTGAQASLEPMELGTTIHAHGLVWFAISTHLPVEEGKPLMHAHLEALQADLLADDESMTGDELQAAIGRQWMAYVECPQAAGGQLIAIASLVLECYVPKEHLGVDDALAVAEVIVETMKRAGGVLVPVYAT